ncbi:hypothetical protein M9H77_05091 [Catharanthus roseus]|uniref:Uncharacterized protein n=1 Tax=Catharanthus roseus TaxID=4058 RepID=A0ACC0CGH2_CATRO|nr:hypothetical protein M9H77_05091 [Catharanthus roseus]
MKNCRWVIMGSVPLVECSVQGQSHVAITPLDVLKVNMQVHPIKYQSIGTCFNAQLREQGPSAFWRGWAGKFFGYGMQGACRFGLYEYFKKVYSDVSVDQNKSLIFFVRQCIR